MIDATLLRTLGWTDELIQAAQLVAKAAEEAVLAATPRVRIEVSEVSDYSVETTTRIDVSMAPGLSGWPQLSRQ